MFQSLASQLVISSVSITLLVILLMSEFVVCPGFESGARGLSVWTFHVGFFACLPQSKEVNIRLMVDCKVPV